MRRLLTRFAVDLAMHLADDIEEARRSHDARGRARWRPGTPLQDQDFNQIWDFVLSNQAGGKGEETIFGKPVGPGLLDRLRWAKTLRNKYEHNNAIEGPEQLADLLLLRQLVKQARSRFDLRSECAGMIEEAIQAELPFYVSRTTELLGLEDKIAELSEASDPGRMATVVPSSVADRLVAAIEGESSKPPTSGGGASVTVSAEDLTAALADLRAVRDAVLVNGRRNEHLVELVSALSERLEVSSPNGGATVEENAPDPWDALDGTGGDEEGGFVVDEVDDLPLLEEEVRDRLIALRWRIWQELGVGPSADGVLRKRMLDQLIEHRITSLSGWLDKVSEADRDRTAPEQLAYLPEVFAIISRLDP